MNEIHADAFWLIDLLFLFLGLQFQQSSFDEAKAKRKAEMSTAVAAINL